MAQRIRIHKAVYIIVGLSLAMFTLWNLIRNPVRIPCRHELNDAIAAGLLSDCRSLIQQAQAPHVLDRASYPTSLKKLKPRRVFVDQDVVLITIWSNRSRCDLLNAYFDEIYLQVGKEHSRGARKSPEYETVEDSIQLVFWEKHRARLKSVSDLLDGH